MSNEVARSNGGLPVNSDTIGGLRKAAAEKPKVGISILRLNGGRWLYGPEDIEVEDDDLWAIHPASFMHGWVAWDAGKPRGEHMYDCSVTPPLAHTLEEYISVAKKTEGQVVQWSRQISFTLAMVEGEEPGTTIVYKNSSLGGQQAWSAVAEAIAERYEEDPANCFPLVELKTDSYVHAEHGKIYTPIFDIVDWTGVEEMEKLLAKGAEMAAAAEEEAAAETAEETAEEPKPQKRTRRAKKNARTEAEADTPAPTTRRRRRRTAA